MPEGLIRLLARLRHPQSGCPWDRRQTPASLCAGILDEAYELTDAIAQADPAEVREELGDLMFQLVFVAYLYQENGDFTLDEALRGVEAKMIRRHPHVFAGEALTQSAQIPERWEQIKLAEHPKRHPLDSIPSALPALAQSRSLWGKARRLGWLEGEAQTPDLPVLLARLLEGGQAEDFAQLLFALVQWGMERNFNPEELLRAANGRFKRDMKARHPLGQ